jgi:16S rRNA (guanine(966)-N(2))-methyltransferase RsmD
MRIISGKFKGINLEGFNIKGTRPTMDRIKESVFATIQNKIKDSIVLDLFAGSGSLGFEALSLGASKAYFIDNNKEVIKILNKNRQKLNITNLEIMQSDYTNACTYFYNHQIKFDIIFLDPPYDDNLINKALELIVTYKLLNDNGLIICEYTKENINEENLCLLKEKKYGEKKIKIYSIN